MPLYSYTNATSNPANTAGEQTSVPESDGPIKVIRSPAAYAQPDTFHLNRGGTRPGWLGKLMGEAFEAAASRLREDPVAETISARPGVFQE